MEDEAETWHTCIGHCPLQKLCFYSGRIRTLVSMAAYIFHSLIKGKVEIGNFYCLIGDNRILFLQQCLIVRLSLLRKTILIPEYLAFMCVCVFVDGCISQF